MAKPKKSVDNSVEIGSMERKIDFKQRKFKFSNKQKKPGKSPGFLKILIHIFRILS